MLAWIQIESIVGVQETCMDIYRAELYFRECNSQFSDILLETSMNKETAVIWVQRATPCQLARDFCCVV
jgi:hypothetical protein